MSVCPKCGRPARGLCLDCFLESNPLVLGDVKLVSCGCGRLRYRDKWDAPLQDVVRDVVKSFKHPFEIRIKKVDVKPEIRDGKLSLQVTADGSYKDSIFRKSFTEQFKLQSTSCPTCSRKNSGYYEAVLQLRCEIPKFVVDENQIAKAEKVRGGFDYYLLSNNYARALTSQLSRKGYDIKTSTKTYSMRDGQTVYRIYYSIKKDSA